MKKIYSICTIRDNASYNSNERSITPAKIVMLTPIDQSNSFRMECCADPRLVFTTTNDLVVRNGIQNIPLMIKNEDINEGIVMTISGKKAVFGLTLEDFINQSLNPEIQPADRFEVVEIKVKEEAMLLERGNMNISLLFFKLLRQRKSKEKEIIGYDMPMAFCVRLDSTLKFKWNHVCIGDTLRYDKSSAGFEMI